MLESFKEQTTAAVDCGAGIQMSLSGVSKVKCL